jgi:hypothetical protein
MSCRNIVRFINYRTNHRFLSTLNRRVFVKNTKFIELKGHVTKLQIQNKSLEKKVQNLTNRLNVPNFSSKLNTPTILFLRYICIGTISVFVVVLLCIAVDVLLRKYRTSSSFEDSIYSFMSLYLFMEFCDIFMKK